jgi:hypothetical protein
MDRGKRGKRRIREMITTNIEWHDANIELPTASGEYFVKSKTDFWIVPYSDRYKRFNTRDEYDEGLMARTAFPAESVQYWAELPEFPVTESEGA